MAAPLHDLMVFLGDLKVKEARFKKLATTVSTLMELLSRFIKPTNLSKLKFFKNQLVVAKAQDAATCLYLYYHAWTAQERFQSSVVAELETLDVAKLRALKTEEVAETIVRAVNKGLTMAAMCDVLFGVWVELVAYDTCSDLFASAEEVPEIQRMPDAQNYAFVNSGATMVLALGRISMPLIELVKLGVADAALPSTRIKTALDLINANKSHVTCKKLRTGFVLCDNKDGVALRLPKHPEPPPERDALHNPLPHQPMGVACRRRRKIYTPKGKPSRAECVTGPLTRCARVAGEVVCPQDVLFMYKVKAEFTGFFVRIEKKYSEMLGMKCEGDLCPPDQLGQLKVK